MMCMMSEKATPLVNQCDCVLPSESVGPDNPYKSKQGVSKREKERKYETYIDCAKVNNSSMPDREDHPAPEDLEIEVDSFLSRLVHLRIPVHVLVINILLKSVGEEARPRGP